MCMSCYFSTISAANLSDFFGSHPKKLDICLKSRLSENMMKIKDFLAITNPSPWLKASVLSPCQLFKALQSWSKLSFRSVQWFCPWWSTPPPSPPKNNSLLWFCQWLVASTVHTGHYKLEYCKPRYSWCHLFIYGISVLRPEYQTLKATEIYLLLNYCWHWNILLLTS